MLLIHSKTGAGISHKSYSQITDVIDRISEIRISMSKSTVNSILYTKSSAICFMDTWSSLVVAKVVSPLSVACSPV